MVRAYVEINGLKISYCSSDGTGSPTVVMVHGNSMSSMGFRPQLEGPFGAQYRMVALDLPGHGLSDRAADPQRAYTIMGHANTLVEFCRALGITRPVLVGWSLGGYVALDAIERLDPVGIVIMGATPVRRMEDIAGCYHPVAALGYLGKEDLARDEQAALAGAFLAQGSASPLVEVLVGDMGRADGRARPAIFAGGLPVDDQVSKLESLRIPVAIFAGSKDIARLEYLQGLSVPALWQGRVHVIEDAGHAAQLDQPGKFNSLLREFIEGL